MLLEQFFSHNNIISFRVNLVPVSESAKNFTNNVLFRATTCTTVPHQSQSYPGPQEANFKRSGSISAKHAHLHTLYCAKRCRKFLADDFVANSASAIFQLCVTLDSKIKSFSRVIVLRPSQFPNVSIYVETSKIVVVRGDCPAFRRLRGFNLANWRIFLLNRKKNNNNSAKLARIIVRNGVACGAHVFAKLKLIVIIDFVTNYHS